MSRALTDEQVGMIVRRLTVIAAGVTAPGVDRGAGSYAVGLADGMTMAYEHALAIINDTIETAADVGPTIRDRPPAGRNPRRVQ